MANYLDEAIAALRKFEGVVPWMYLDTVGRVTVGVGLMLPSLEAARSLPFVFGDRDATSNEITKEFARVTAMKPGLLAKLYRKARGLSLNDATIDDRLRKSLVGFEGYLRSSIAGYDALPDAAKLGLLDMIYNLGPGKLFSEFPKLMEAVASGNWAAASRASARRGIAQARNDWTRQQFLNAAATLKHLEAEAEEHPWLTLFWGALTGVAVAAGTALLLERTGARSRR